MNKDIFSERYSEYYPFFQRLLMNSYSVIQDQLINADIQYLNFEKRIKTVDSAFEKFIRKSYQDPFSQIEDFCGLRIICHYPSDVERIISLLRNEFTILSEENTQARLKPNEFGYRSTHMIFVIPDGWLAAPEYRGLKGFKVEVQIRTILMHAWAEIQHKFAYKSASQVPEDFQRIFFRLSAKFEEADEQLDKLRDDLLTYRSNVLTSTNENITALRGKPLNLDTLTVLLDAAYPDRDKSALANSDMLSEVMELSLSMDDLIDAIIAQRPIIDQLEEMEKEELDNGEINWIQVGALRGALDIANDVYYAAREKEYGDTPYFAILERQRELLKGRKK
ncbi:GTP pyrophosphokinase [Massilia aurea]|nr:hypothetical protein [Massilia aurea]